MDLTGQLTDQYLEIYRDYFKSVENIGYYIHDEVSLIDNPSYWSWTHWDGHEAVIKKAFDDIDPYIDLDFYKANNVLEAQIHIYRVSPYPGIPGDTVGFALGSHEGALIPSQANDDLFQSVVWTDFPDDYSLYYSTNPYLEDENGYDFGSAQWQDAYTIIHEIGHALGLSHPQSNGEDDPYGGHHSSTQTVMSYNTDIKYSQWGIFGYVPSWTSEDISHLELIWGSENGNDDHPTNGPDSLRGTEDQDSVYLFDGDDTYYAGKGDDLVRGGNGEDFIDGQDGNDVLIGGFAAYKDELLGGRGDDLLGGGGGPDHIYGQEDNDEIRAGHGKDLLSGGSGADILYGGGGTNTFLSELDGSVDELFILSDYRSHGEEWGRNHGGINADVMQGLDTDDRITILGTTDSELSFREVVAGTYNQSQAGIGIFDGEMLEAIYVGSNLDANQLDSITGTDPSRFW